MSLVNFINSQAQNQGQAPGTQAAHLEKNKGAAGAKVREQVGSVTDAGSCTAMTHWCPCCSLKQGPGGQKPRK